MNNFRSKSVLASMHECMNIKGAGTEEDRTSKALVVNFRRLIKMKEMFQILHEIMRSTTIAFLTLMAVKSVRWLVCDLIALLACVGLYALHANKYDTLEVNDYNNLVELLGDDGDSVLLGAPLPLENPNRWLQAVTYSKTVLHVWLPYIFLSFFIIFVTASWTYVASIWLSDGTQDVARFWPEEELEHPVTLLLVGTLMLMCHVVFEVMYWRETQYCMPLKDGRPWRLKEDGLPNDAHMCNIFGAPCIWFSTPQAYDDLRIWVTLASGERKSAGRKHARSQDIWPRVFFEELALYAIQEETSATRLRRSLLQAKLFDKQTDAFLRRATGSDAQASAGGEGRPPHVEVRGVSEQYAGSSSCGKVGFHKVDIRAGQRPEELGLDLLFYDNRSGVYWAPDSLDIEVFRDKVVSHQLRKSDSITPPRSRSSLGSNSLSVHH